jgi:metal-responsive CopG/Arc/MetJ family transcriptional regulator
MPVVFSKAFYKTLADYAVEFRTTRSRFVMKAVRYYAEEMRKKHSPMGKAIPSQDIVSAYRDAQGAVSKEWWATLTPEERSARAKKAIEARWGKPKKKK